MEGDECVMIGIKIIYTYNNVSCILYANFM